jgi:putative hydrolase of the HAD superfamily
MLVGMATRAVLFDIGGVLVTGPGPQEWANQFATRVGLSLVDFEARTDEIWDDGALGRLSLAEVHDRLAAVLGTSMSTVDDMMAVMWVGYLGRGTEVIEYARTLRPRYRTGILSNSFVGAREREQAKYGIEELVDELLYSHEIGVAKPDPQAFALACERLGVRPAETVFVDDTPECVQAAQECGIQAVLCRDPAQAIADIQALLG